MLENSKLVLKIKEIEERKNPNGSAPQYAFIVNNLEKVATELLGTICEFMPEYTKHNIDHSINVLNIFEKILPDIEALNITELIILVYAAVLHDIGMVATREEIILIKESEEYKSLLAEYRFSVTDEEVITEFIRRNHVSRSLNFIDKIKKSPYTYGLCFDLDGIDFSFFLKKVIYSHGIDGKELYNEREYPTEILIGEDYVNIKYLCVLLRLADILDFDKTRTPKFMYEHIGIKNEISMGEWKKHLSIEGHRIEKNKIEFRAKCKDAATERCVRTFLNYIEKERRNDVILLDRCNSNKKLELINPIIYNVESDGSYLYSDVEIFFDYKKVLNILMGTNIYRSPEIFLRELLQNAYDACNTRRALGIKYGKFIEPAKIKITYDSKSKVFSIIDNGIGMSDDDINNYVVRVGHSYYESKQYISERLDYTPISHFGIGMLSCFMVSDEIQIESLKYCLNRESIDPVNIVLKINDSFIEKYPSTLEIFGTRISLKVKDDFAEKLDYEKLVKIVEDNMAYQTIPIEIECDGKLKILDKATISLQDGIEKISGIQVIKVNTELLEGYIVLHGYQHQSLLHDVKLCQQGFKISLKNGAPNLKPEWLVFLKYNLNIKKKYLTLQASREGLVENDNFNKTRIEIGKCIIQYYKDSPIALSRFLDTGKGNVLSMVKEENDFLAEAAIIRRAFYDGFRDMTIKKLIEMLKGRESKIAIINHEVNELFKINEEKYMLFCSDHIVILDQFNAYLFMQYVDSYIERIEDVIDECPGVVYVEVLINIDKNFETPIKNSEYFWKSKKSSRSDLFCYTFNDQGNFLDIIFNESNPNVKILNNNLEDIRVRGLKGIIEENIRQRILNHNSKWESIVDYGGSFVNIIDQRIVPSIQSIGCLELGFAELLNDFIHNKYTDEELEEMNISNICFKKEDFVTWWYRTEGYCSAYVKPKNDRR
ncbi:MAG: HD domain-containing protein [Lachnospiraceae bacterium]|jgi:molecular chaperone HtpG|nr:HD domain-containing protein [Lachnospiraceae bacterium]